jgi:hypothetical protein
MKYVWVSILIGIMTSTTTLGQKSSKSNSLEEKIRALEQAQVEAVLRNDLKALRSNQAKDYVVNNPFNVAVDASKGPVLAGRLTYSSFTREVERVLIHGTAVIVMGRETVVPSGISPDAGKTINRRFTNVWMKRGGKWLLTARHASVVCQE